MTQTADTLLDRLGRWLARRLQAESSGYEPYTPSDPETLRRTLEPGDILLVEGNQHISAAIKYLTQSTWSHSALYVGDALPEPADGSERPRLIEVNLGEGCVAVPLSKYRTYNTRICRANGLSPEDREHVVRLHDRQARPEIRPQEHLRHAALFPADAAGAGALAPPHDRLRLGRPDARHLLVADRRGLWPDPLSDPAGDHARARPRLGAIELHRGARSCTSATTRSTRRATSTCRPISASSSRRWNTASTTSR